MNLCYLGDFSWFLGVCLSIENFKVMILIFLLDISMKHCTVTSRSNVLFCREVKCYKLFQNQIAEVQFLRSLDKNILRFAGLEQSGRSEDIVPMWKGVFGECIVSPH